MNIPSLQFLVLHIKEDFFWETALCCDCAVFYILSFRYELWKSEV